MDLFNRLFNIVRANLPAGDSFDTEPLPPPTEEERRAEREAGSAGSTRPGRVVVFKSPAVNEGPSDCSGSSAEGVCERAGRLR